MGFRAPNLLAAARQVAEGKIVLPDLRSCAVDEARERLVQLPGVGPKIANCVLLFAYGFHTVVTYNHDRASRLTSRNYVGSSSTDTDSFTYDTASRMLTAASGRYVNTVGFTYDSAGRKSTESLTISGQTYTVTTGYNAASQLISYQYPDGTPVTRGYSPRGELTTIGYDGTTIDTRTYDNSGRMVTSTYNNGVSETRAYNSDNTLSAITFNGAPIGNLSYTWDANKNKTSESITGVMSGKGFSIPSNGYDSEDRLVNYQRSDNNLNQSWNLSLVGD